MHRKDLEIKFVVIFIILALVYMALYFPAWTFEDGTNNSFFAKYAYATIEIITFSAHFFSSFLPDLLALVFSLAFSSLIITICFIAMRYLFAFLKK